MGGRNCREVKQDQQRERREGDYATNENRDGNLDDNFN
jgi:hypothetical protein